MPHNRRDNETMDMYRGRIIMPSRILSRATSYVARGVRKWQPLGLRDWSLLIQRL
jgi:hypothetical protein